jgi:cysteine desulfurase
MIYLDYNATAPVRPEVAEAMFECYGLPSNASSVHYFGRQAKKKLEEARETIAQAISAWPNEVIFTGCATEANMLALNAFPERQLVVAVTEHASVLKTNDNAVTILVDQDGVIDLKALADILQTQDKPCLISVMLANNETGVIQPIREIVTIAEKYNALVHCDAVQALGKIAFDFTTLGVDMMTLGAHKMGGPLGAAALIIKNKLAIPSLLKGGGQELGRRAGTENIAAIVGFAKAVELIDLKPMQQLREWLDGMEDAMLSSIDGAVLFGKSVERLPNTSCVMMPGVPSETQLMTLDLKGLAISAGSACSSGKIEPSHVIKAMGYSDSEAACTIRISGGWNTTKEDIETMHEAWQEMAIKLLEQQAA